MKPTTFLFIAIALFQGYRYAKGREGWRLPLALFWGALTGYSLTHARGWVPVLIVMLLAALVLKFRARPALGGASASGEAAKDEEDGNAEDLAEKAREEAEAAETREMEQIVLVPQAEIAFTLEEDAEIEVAGAKRVVRAGEYTGTLAFAAPFLEQERVGEGTPIECLFGFQEGANRWRSRSWLRNEYAFNLERDELNQTAVYWKDAPAAWKEALRTRVLIGQAHVLDDGRSRFVIEIGAARHCIMTKYCDWRLTLAVIEGGRRLLVRTHRLYSELWGNGPEAEDGGEFLDIETVPAFCWTLPVEAILPLTTPEVHGVEPHDDDGEEPVRFEPVAG